MVTIQDGGFPTPLHTWDGIEYFLFAVRSLQLGTIATGW